jgi:hypothetical protein
MDAPKQARPRESSLVTLLPRRALRIAFFNQRKIDYPPDLATNTSFSFGAQTQPPKMRRHLAYGQPGADCVTTGEAPQRHARELFRSEDR